jgi:hypothetical protein
MYRLFDLIRAVRSALQPYQVLVSWEGETIVHRAWTRADALAWAGCYPCASVVDVMTRRGRFVAMRRGGEPVTRHSFDVVPTCGYTGGVL